MNKDEPVHFLNDNAVVFDIQRFSLHDGPGIRTTVFFKGCPLSCAWCQNPESQNFRPELIFYKESCIQCFDCRKHCPENAISDHSMLRFDPKRCTLCGQCVTQCLTNSLRMIGKKWSAADLLEEIYKDIDFFIDSGGGITLSGGEPLLQANFLFQWLPMVKEKKIHTTLETCGLANWMQIEKLLPWLDIVFYDLKHMNDSIHKEYTGYGNAGILENFSRLSRSKSGLQARMPVIPGINNSVENIQATANFLKSNHHFSIHLLPYHNLGEAKLKRIYSQQRPMNIAALDSEQLQKTQEMFKKEKIHAVLYD